ncbi:family 16 glycoside hydrolase [Lacinutrix sp.]|uniref:family 16 glycoside hydrolase n=1 Tax=Lacinutrix sp. TaxID=1937692 RepID=UPI003452DDA6
MGASGHNTGGIHVYYRGWLIKPDSIKDKVHKMGEWNHLKIIVKDNKIIVRLNNTKMVSLIN